MKLLVVEDSNRLRYSLSHGLNKLGYAVDAVADGEEAIKYLAVADYDVVILDIMLPKIDGLSVLQQMRANQNESHVLILSAKDQVKDRIAGLELGADDYLIKPFSFDELNARICVLVRRAYKHKTPIIPVACFKYNSALKELSIDGMTVPLTPSETSVLECLLLNCGRVISYEKLEEKLYNYETCVTRNAIEAHISTLRKKLKKYDSTDIIKTRRGFGYYIEKA
jgi:DNA-binding response OmpR family regulator